MLARLLVAPMLLSPWPQHANAPAVLMRAPADVAPPVEEPLLLRANAGLAVGGVLLTLLVGNRLFTDELLNSQSRADLIGAVGPVLIILKALGDLDITPVEKEAVPPAGVLGEWVEPSLPEAVRTELGWASSALLEMNGCTTVALWRDGRTVMLRGVLPSRTVPGPDAVAPGVLLSKAAARTNGAPDYLPALQLLPGRVEFSYLPENAQGVLMLPLTGETRGALLLACDRQRGFGPDDVEWARAIAGRVAESLESA